MSIVIKNTAKRVIRMGRIAILPSISGKSYPKEVADYINTGGWKSYIERNKNLAIVSEDNGVDMNNVDVGDIKHIVESINDKGQLISLLNEEKTGKNRSTAVKAIEKRIEELA